MDIPWVKIGLIIFAVILVWALFKQGPAMVKADFPNAMIDSSKDIGTKAIDLGKSALNQNPSLPPPTTSNNFGKVPCTTTEQCIQAYPICTNCTCIGGECISNG